MPPWRDAGPLRWIVTGWPAPGAPRSTSASSRTLHPSPRHPRDPPKRHRWNIDAARATSMGHRCCFPAGVGADPGRPATTGGADGADGASETGGRRPRTAGTRRLPQRRLPLAAPPQRRLPQRWKLVALAHRPHHPSSASVVPAAPMSLSTPTSHGGLLRPFRNGSSGSAWPQLVPNAPEQLAVSLGPPVKEGLPGLVRAEAFVTMARVRCTKAS
jgi:hypothetical protein